MLYGSNMRFLSKNRGNKVRSFLKKNYKRNFWTVQGCLNRSLEDRIRSGIPQLFSTKLQRKFQLEKWNEQDMYDQTLGSIVRTVIEPLSVGDFASSPSSLLFSCLGKTGTILELLAPDGHRSSHTPPSSSDVWEGSAPSQSLLLLVSTGLPALRCRLSSCLGKTGTISEAPDPRRYWSPYTPSSSPSFVV